MTLRAKAPVRATKTLHISFGPIPLTCSVYTGSDTGGVSRSEFVPVTTENDEVEYHPVGRKPYDKVTNDDVNTDEVVRMIQTDNGLVEVTDEEVESLVDFPGETATVIGFFPQDLLSTGHYVTDKVYQIRPKKIESGKKKVPNAPVERAFALILRVMRKNQSFALIQMAFRGAPRFGAILPNGRLYTLLFDEEVREDLPLPDVEPTEKEVALMSQIIASESFKEPVDANDVASAAILAYAGQKAAGGEVIEPKTAETSTDSITDLEGMLTSMLEK